MMNYKAIAFILITFIASNAQANDYMVKNVKVDVTADSATDARNTALDKARMNAFDVLKGRIMSASEQGALPVVTSSAVSTMVDSFEINREKLSKNRYLASVNVMFNERAVQSYLGRYTNMAMPDQYFGGEDNLNNDTYVSKQTAQPSHLYNQQQKINSNTTLYTMQVNVNNIRQWINVQKSLQSIGHVRIQSLNAKKAIVVLSYDGDASNLQGDLNIKGMQLYSNSAGNVAPYLLMMRG